MNETGSVWVFNGNRNKFPSGVFESLEAAKLWIKENKLTGTLTEYPLNIGIFDWVIQLSEKKAEKLESKRTPDFVANFSSAMLKHYHFEKGE